MLGFPLSQKGHADFYFKPSWLFFFYLFRIRFFFFWWSTLTNYCKHFPKSICREFISPVGYFFIQITVIYIYTKCQSAPTPLYGNLCWFCEFLNQLTIVFRRKTCLLHLRICFENYHYLENTKHSITISTGTIMLERWFKKWHSQCSESALLSATFSKLCEHQGNLLGRIYYV